MTVRNFIQWLGPISLGVFVGGWVLAALAFFAIGNETCTDVDLGIAGQIRTCTDTSAQAVILLVVVGFGATLSSLFLWGLRYLLETLEAIETNTRRR